MTRPPRSTPQQSPQAKEPRRHELLPADASRCIWMQAGLVSYKLCDYDFECERCPFDRALRPHGSAELPHTESSERAHDFVFPDDRSYSGKHLWLKEIAPQIWRVGVDVLFAQLLLPPTHIRLPARGAHLALDSPAVSVDTDGGSVCLRAPIRSAVAEHNALLVSSPEMLQSSPYAAGWLVDLQVDVRMDAERDPLVSNAWLTAQQAHDRAALDLRRFQRQAAMLLLSGTENAGATMADGGVPLTDLRAMLGKSRYLTLLRDILC